MVAWGYWLLLYRMLVTILAHWRLECIGWSLFIYLQWRNEKRKTWMISRQKIKHLFVALLFVSVSVLVYLMAQVCIGWDCIEYLSRFLSILFNTPSVMGTFFMFCGFIMHFVICRALKLSNNCKTDIFYLSVQNYLYNMY